MTKRERNIVIGAVILYLLFRKPEPTQSTIEVTSTDANPTGPPASATFNVNQ